jgi:2-succinyl-5-enolpyruvyl-6-hydroxy-3-cyclohexene-1-carboxylate synthase
MSYSSIPVARQLLSACLKNKLQRVVISPGSRSAPLTLSFGAHPEIQAFTIVDERSAAFFALGLALQSNEPVALICTSGSALLNYYPAICEAFYSEVPLLVLSADRPAYLIDRGDGQTIRQDGVLKQHCHHSVGLFQDVEHSKNKIKRFGPEQGLSDQAELEAKNNRLIQQAFYALGEDKGPVHINIPLEEPLYEKWPGKESDLVHAYPHQPAEKRNEEVFVLEEKYKSLWTQAKRKLVLIGQINQAPQNKPLWLNQLILDPNAVVLTETTSNLNHPESIDSIDSVIAPLEKDADANRFFEALKPEIVITIGGMVVSKKIKKFLRDYSPGHHWHIGLSRPYDTFFCLDKHWEVDPIRFFEGIYGSSDPSLLQGKEPSYRGIWDRLKANYQDRRAVYLEEIPFSDFKVFGNLFQAIPEGFDLHLANSSAIRYAQLFPHKESWKTYCNRGTSGIDGSTSTAVGAAWESPNPAVLVTGDLSFFYDSNAFWNAYAKKNLRVVLINNDGGGIFRILPGKEESLVFEQHFETPHGRNAKLHCEQYGWNYQAVKSTDELITQLSTFFSKSSQASILEVFTPRRLNDKVLLEYFEFLNLELNFNKTLSHYEQKRRTD